MISKRSVLSVLLILFIWWAGYKGYEAHFFQTLKPIVKHTINLALLVSVALAGLFSLAQFSEKWLVSIWVVVYSLVIILLIIIGVVDLFHRINSSLIRDSIVPFRMFFMSPFPLLILMFLKMNLKKGKLNTNN